MCEPSAHRVVANSNHAPRPGWRYPNGVMTNKHRDRFLVRRSFVFAAIATCLVGCATTRAPTDLHWLPPQPGWAVTDADEAEPATWVALDREAPGTRVKEIRVVGLVNADPETTMRALRHRLLAPEYVPEQMDVEILEESDREVLTYGLARMPWPMKDREVTERMRFSHDAKTGVFRVDVNSVDPQRETEQGVVRVDLVRSLFLVEPDGSGGSVLTASSVHDMGGAFPNRAVYAPVRKGMVDMLDEVRELSTSIDTSSRSEDL